MMITSGLKQHFSMLPLRDGVEKRVDELYHGILIRLGF